MPNNKKVDKQNKKEKNFSSYEIRTPNFIRPEFIPVTKETIKKKANEAKKESEE